MNMVLSMFMVRLLALLLAALDNIYAAIVLAPAVVPINGTTGQYGSILKLIGS